MRYIELKIKNEPIKTLVLNRCDIITIAVLPDDTVWIKYFSYDKKGKRRVRILEVAHSFEELRYLLYDYREVAKK